jgi:hypothetical protein
MARLIAYGLIPMLMALLVGGAALGQGMQTFKTEKTAQRHCPADTVVWVNTSSANYHFKGLALCIRANRDNCVPVKYGVSGSALAKRIFYIFVKTLRDLRLAEHPLQQTEHLQVIFVNYQLFYF